MNAPNTAVLRRREQSMQAGSILLYGTFVLLLLGPLAFGTVEPWSIFLLEATTTALFLFWVGKQVLDGEVKVR